MVASSSDPCRLSVECQLFRVQAVQNNGTLYMHTVFEATVFVKTEADVLGSPRTRQWIRSWRAFPASSYTC